MNEGGTHEELSNRLKHEHFVEVSGKRIHTNSVQVATKDKKYGKINCDKNDCGACSIQIDDRCGQDFLAELITDAMDNQIKIDRMQMFVCEIDDQEVDQRRVQEAQSVETQCHEAQVEEVAWDDVNDCNLDPVTVWAARNGVLREDASLSQSAKAAMPRYDGTGAHQGQMGG